MSELITQNKKMKKSGNKKVRVLNFGITALKTSKGMITCPFAGVCAEENGCYARQGSYTWSTTMKAYEWRAEETKKPTFSADYIKALTTKKKTSDRKGESLFNRIHDSGDFYSLAYWQKWEVIIRAFPEVMFYAYTKNVPLFKRLEREGKLPFNFIIIYSFGGKYDFLIDKEKDRHSMVFKSLYALKKAGYVNASNNDLKALGKNPKIGLVYHGTKNYENTHWHKLCA